MPLEQDRGHHHRDRDQIVAHGMVEIHCRRAANRIYARRHQPDRYRRHPALDRIAPQRTVKVIPHPGDCKNQRARRKIKGDQCQDCACKSGDV
jgi:hypothetical protein